MTVSPFKPLLPLAAATLLWGLGMALQPANAPRWWKGNTHTHTLWSDGNALPELAVAWYKERGYSFLALTDHNILQESETWFPVATAGGARLQPDQVRGVADAPGSTLEQRTREGQLEVRLSRHAELMGRFNSPGSFLLVSGEEITSNWRSPGANGRGHPVHINAIGLKSFLPPARGRSVVDVMGKVFDSIAALDQSQTKSGDGPVLGHLNHPNFGWGVTALDMAKVRSMRFFEVYNGHTGTRDAGDDSHPSTDQMWDLANIQRCETLKLPLIFGIGTDDTHHYHGGKVAGPGRGWIRVRSNKLDFPSLARAMNQGDFYASSGVELQDIQVTSTSLEVKAISRGGEVLTIEFLGARKSKPGAPAKPVVLATSQGHQARYEFVGDELFVRARITSSWPHPAPKVAGETMRAWTQPVRP